MQKLLTVSLLFLSITLFSSCEPEALPNSEKSLVDVKTYGGTGEEDTVVPEKKP